MSTHYETDLARVREVWSENAGTWGGRKLHWLEHPAVHNRINFKVSRVAGFDRFQFFFQCR